MTIDYYSANFTLSILNNNGFVYLGLDIFNTGNSPSYA